MVVVLAGGVFFICLLLQQPLFCQLAGCELCDIMSHCAGFKVRRLVSPVCPQYAKASCFVSMVSHMNVWVLQPRPAVQHNTLTVHMQTRHVQHKPGGSPNQPLLHRGSK